MIMYFARNGVLCYLETENDHFGDKYDQFMDAMKYADLVFMETGQNYKVIKSRQNASMTNTIYFDIKYLFLDAECGIIGKVRAQPYNIGTFVK